jgi:hypothetical protein
MFELVHISGSYVPPERLSQIRTSTKFSNVRVPLIVAALATTAFAGCGGSNSGTSLPASQSATGPTSSAISAAARTGSPAPAASATTAPATNVTLIYRGVTNSTSWYYQGATNGTTTCNNTSYVPGTFSTAPKVINGPLAAGDLVGIDATLYNWQNVVVPSGTCPDHMTGVTTIVDLSHGGATGTATAAPTTSAAPVGSAAPVTGMGAAANYTSIVNGQSWPTSFRPYCVNAAKNPAAPCPFNDTLPDSGATLATSSTAIVTAMNNAGDLEFGFWHGEDSGGAPVYAAKSSDPMVTVSCTSYCQASSVSINIPAQARPEAALCPGDCQMAVIQPDGTEYALYGQKPAYSGGSTLSVMGLAWASITGSGVDPNSMSLTFPGRGGGDVANGTMMASLSEPTVAEIQSGTISHALSINVPCESGQVYPGSNGEDCAQNFGYAGPPAGSRFQLALTNAQIDGTAANSIGYNAASTAPWERAILHAMHNYGAYASITCGRGCGDRINVYMENGTQYSSFGGTWPVSSYNWSSPGNNGSAGSVPTNWKPGGITWSSALQIVSPCYALEQC